MKAKKRKTDAQVLQDLAAPGLKLRVASHRLRYVGRVSVLGPAVLHTLIRSGDGKAWRQELIQDMLWMQTTLSPRLDELGNPQAEPEAWEQLWTRWPSQWKMIALSVNKKRWPKPKPQPTKRKKTTMSQPTAAPSVGQSSQPIQAGRRTEGSPTESAQESREQPFPRNARGVAEISGRAYASCITFRARRCVERQSKEGMCL